MNDVEKCLELIKEIYDKGNTCSFVLEQNAGKAAQYTKGRQAGIELCIQAIETEFKIKSKK